MGGDEVLGWTLAVRIRWEKEEREGERERGKRMMEQDSV